jgi:hypothetical protein
VLGVFGCRVPGGFAAGCWGFGCRVLNQQPRGRCHAVRRPVECAGIQPRATTAGVVVPVHMLPSSSSI